MPRPSSKSGRAARWLLALALAGCGVERIDHGLTDGGVGDGGIEDLTVSGSVSAGVGYTAPAHGKVVVLWQRTGQHPYKLGEGSSTGATFSVRVPTALPTVAEAAAGMGVGFLALFGESVAIADGPVDLDAYSSSLLGTAPLHALVWKRTGATLPAWISAFGLGYTCGQESDAVGQHDALSPIPCTEVRIVVDSPLRLTFPEWTGI